MSIQVVKRDGRKVPFESSKIYYVIQKSVLETQKLGLLGDKARELVEEDIMSYISSLTDEVVRKVLAFKCLEIEVEAVQDVVQQVLNSHSEQVGVRFEAVRRERRRNRQQREDVFKNVEAITKITDRENANVRNGITGKLLQTAETILREMAIQGLPSHIRTEFERMLIYGHDFAWSPLGSTTCLQIPLRKILKGGFYLNGNFTRQPKRISTAAELTCVILQANQNEQHGGQSFGWIDRDLSPYVEAEYHYQLTTGVSKEKAWESTREETRRAMKGMLSNFNVMNSRGGGQVPFSSVNLGTDTTRGGRLITEMILVNYERGLGKGEQMLFPNIIFKVKKGINFEPGTCNHDLLWHSLRVSSKRLYPIYNFQDCTLNAPYDCDVPSMGCRTRVAANIHSKDQSPEGRGNLSFTTINLPGIALEQRRMFIPYEKTEDGFIRLITRYDLNLEFYRENHVVGRFFVRLNELIELAIEQLLIRYKQQCQFRKKDFEFLMSGNWMDSEYLGEFDTLESVLKHGGISVGFIGLAETLKVLINKHHAQDEEALNLGLEIISFMAKKMEEATEIHQLNFGLLATPAEGLTGKLLRHDREKYGIIEGVTDKEWYTNSCHVPVEYNISFYDKIRIEGNFVKYCSAGTITYIELSESPSQNPEAMYRVIQIMSEADIALGAVNFPSDRCMGCQYAGVIDQSDTCPVCGSEDIERIARITGYLAPLKNFNSAKKQEFLGRVKHDA